MGRHVSKRKKEVMAHKLGVEIGKSDPLNP